MSNNDDLPPRGQSVENEGEAVLPLVEERISLHRHPKEGRTVSVTTRPVTEEVTVRKPLVHEAVSVERVPVDRVVDEVPPVREEGDLTIIPVVEERITVSTELVLTEEVHLRRTRREVTEEAVVQRTRTDVTIDEHNAPEA